MQACSFVCKRAVAVRSKRTVNHFQRNREPSFQPDVIAQRSCAEKDTSLTLKVDRFEILSQKTHCAIPSVIVDVNFFFALIDLDDIKSYRILHNLQMQDAAAPF